MDKFVSYKVFVTLAETRSFTQTASRLYMSQPTVSRIIAHLEQDLKTVLFFRTTKSLSLTQSGEMLLRDVKPILMSLHNMEEGLVDQENRVEGVIKMAAPIFIPDTFYPIIGKFLALYPGVTIDLQVSNQYVDLEYLGIDVALRIFSSKKSLKSSSGVVAPIAKRQLVFVSTPGYLAGAGTPTHPKELVDFNCLTYTPHQTFEEWGYQDSGKLHQVLVSGSLRSSTMLPIKECLMLGLGIAYLPDYYVSKELKAGQLVTILDPFKPEKHDISLIITRPSFVSSAVKILVDFLEVELPLLFNPGGVPN